MKKVYENNSLQLILKEYAKIHKNIKNIYVDNNKVLIIVDDITVSNILEYYDFCFDIIHSYDVESYNIFDIKEFNHMKDTYKSYKKIY